MASVDAQVWTEDEVQYRLGEAADCLRRMPMGKNARPSTRSTAWPDVVQETFDAWISYGREDARTRPAAPSSEDIDRMDEVMQWLMWLSADQRRVIWARACDIKWRRLEDIDGRSVRTLQRLHNDGLCVIARRLNKICFPAKKS
jgi:hypothetical protein